MRRKTRGPNHSPSCTPASVVGGGEVFGPLLAWPSFVINRLDRGIHPASLRQRRPKRCTVYSATLLCIDLGRCLTVGQGGHGARGGWRGGGAPHYLVDQVGKHGAHMRGPVHIAQRGGEIGRDILQSFLCLRRPGALQGLAQQPLGLRDRQTRSRRIMTDQIPQQMA